MLKQVAPLSGRTFAGAVIMPNLQPPIEDVRALLDYKKRIEEAIGEQDLIPHMTVNFKNYTPKDLQLLDAYLVGIKMYPRG
jgi:dihydroorotase